MKNKKHGMKYQIRTAVLRMYGIQIASVLTFYVFSFLVKCFTDSETLPIQLLLSLLTEATICWFAWRHVWKIGDFHQSDVLLSDVRLDRTVGLRTGLYMVAPILVFGILCSVLDAFRVDISVLSTILSLFVFRWSGVVERLTLLFNGSPWVGAAALVFECLPLVLTSVFAFKYGFLGRHESLIRFRRRHCEEERNADAERCWTGAAKE